MTIKFRLLFSSYFLLAAFSVHSQLEAVTIQETGISSVHVSGMANFITFYRDMSQAFPGTAGGTKSWAFSPYTASNKFSGNFAQQPFLTLNLAANPSANASFSVDYALTHLFSGNDSSKNIMVQNLFQFHGDVENKWGSFHLRAGGGVMDYSLSPMTMYNKDFRESNFDRVPWEWRMKSFDIYEDNYQKSKTTSPTLMNNSAVQGVIFEGEDLPFQLGFSSFYGRSSNTLTPSRALADYPLQIIAGKVYKVFSRKEQLGINFYNQFGYTNPIDKVKDNRAIITTNYDLTNDKIQIHGELGGGRLDNPESNKAFGEAIDLSLTLLNEKKKMPLRIQYYRISKNVAALESAVLNANSAVQQGGYGSNRAYENSLYPAYLQEVDMKVNNRQGLILNLDKSLKSFKIELGYALSQELENQFQGVSYQHMVNSFSRSRFQPWIMGAGPYGRVSNRFRRSFETIALTDNSNALKTFNALDLNLKYKFQVFDRDLILMNYTYFGNVGNSLAPWNKKYINTVFEELSAYYQVTQKLNLLTFYSNQNTQGGEGTEKATNGNYLHQQGHGYGFGIDYDFKENAGLYFRHRWMNHRDANFVDDKFKGTESTIELKYYF